MLLAKFLRRVVRIGSITIIGPFGGSKRVHVTDFPRVTLRLKAVLLIPKLILVPNFYIAESYVNGELEIAEGSLRDLLAILMQSISDNAQPTFFDKTRRLLANGIDLLSRIGRPSKSRKHVQYHYDLSDDFFRLFLDSNLQYSCAYFLDEGQSLEDAQLAKMRHIASKLLLRPMHRVLDIGSGWGGLANFLNSIYDVNVVGITLSRNQHRASEVTKKSGEVNFYLRDYRDEQGRYDRIVSVGMLEHVGQTNYKAFFRKIEHLLEDDGVALMHTIGRRGIPAPINIWIRRKIFPGAYVPSLSQLAGAIEKTGLWVLDCESLRLHYAKTLQVWCALLAKHRPQIETMYSAKFFRAWEFYLTSCELGFLYQGLTVYQLLLGKRPDAVPITRDYMHREESEFGTDIPRSAASTQAAE